MFHSSLRVCACGEYLILSSVWLRCICGTFCAVELLLLCSVCLSWHTWVLCVDSFSPVCGITSTHTPLQQHMQGLAGTSEEYANDGASADTAECVSSDAHSHILCPSGAVCVCLYIYNADKSERSSVDLEVKGVSTKSDSLRFFSFSLSFSWESLRTTWEKTEDTFRRPHYRNVSAKGRCR